MPAGVSRRRAAVGAAPDGVVWHLLLPAGKGWGAGDQLRFKVQTLKERIDVINAEGGAITFDVPISSDGKIPEKILQGFQELGTYKSRLNDGVKSFLD